jgi:hypothetical protein
MLALLAIFAVAIYYLQSRRGEALKQRHPWVAYLLVWPLILDANKEKRSGRIFTSREWLGFALMAALIACGILFFS